MSRTLFSTVPQDEDFQTAFLLKRGQEGEQQSSSSLDSSGINASLKIVLFVSKK